MAVAWFGNYILQPGTSGPTTMNPPASTAAGDQEILWVSSKLASGNTPTLSVATWNPLGSFVVGTGADGAGTGQIRLTAWWRELTAAAGTTDVSLASGNVFTAGGSVWRKSAGERWAAPRVTPGTDTSSGTGFSAPGADNFTAITGDFIYSVGSTTANTTLSTRSITAAGLTLTVTGIDSGGTANGNDLFCWTDRAQVTAGTQTGVATTTGTTAASTTGGSLLFRIALAPLLPIYAQPPIRRAA